MPFSLPTRQRWLRMYKCGHLGHLGNAVDGNQTIMSSRSLWALLYYSCCHILWEFKTALALRRQPVILLCHGRVTVTVEHDFSDTCGDGFLSDSLANLGCNFTPGRGLLVVALQG